jgi:hypothetical protein
MVFHCLVPWVLNNLDIYPQNPGWVTFNRNSEREREREIKSKIPTPTCIALLWPCTSIWSPPTMFKAVCSPVDTAVTPLMPHGAHSCWYRQMDGHYGNGMSQMKFGMKSQTAAERWEAFCGSGDLYGVKTIPGSLKDVTQKVTHSMHAKNLWSYFDKGRMHGQVQLSIYNKVLAA